MGVKISKVRDKRTLKEVTVKDCEAGFTGEYLCVTDGCNAQMSFVKAYEQRRFRKIIQVPAFFKLKANEKHVYEKCPYNTKGAVEIIARRSDSNVLKALDSHKYEFSLQVLHDANTATKRFETSGDELKGDNNGKNRKGKEYTHRGKASNYIKVLSQILTLRARLENNKELSSLITLNYRGKKIKWDDFYFEEDGYMKAFEIAGRLKKTTYPMCLHGIVSKHIPANEHFIYPKIGVYGPHIPLEKDLTPMPSLECPIPNESLDFGLFPIRSEVLIYGEVRTNISKKGWVSAEESKKENPKKIQFLNMDVWINHPEQLVKLS